MVRHYFYPLSSLRPAQRGYGWQARCGCSSVVEHLLAKGDVASSSLVTRSSLRFERSLEVEAGASAVALAKADTQTSYGWQASLLLLKDSNPYRKTRPNALCLLVALATIAQRFSAGYGQSTDPSPGRDERNVLSSLPGLQTIKRGN